MSAYRIGVLDHGFVELRNLSGPTRRLHNGPPDLQGNDFMEAMLEPREFDADDVDPANAARMSFNQMDSGRTREQDLKLCDYLMRNWHNSPFEMVEAWIEMKLPIFVARQFVRHRTVSINEVSGRYVKLPAEWYIPEFVGGKPVNAKQGQTDNLPNEIQRDFKFMLDTNCRNSYQAYEWALEQGVAAEHARMHLHLNHYTHWLWKQDLHNLMHFLRLRDHSHAQVEAQLFAKAIDVLLRAQLPNTMALYDKYRRLEQ
jgi:thymidylate synthase (FAD)